MQNKPQPLPDGWQDEIKHHGWMLPGLFLLDMRTQARWSHWADCVHANKLIGDKIPQVHWSRTAEGRKVWESMLDAVTAYGGWRGWGSWRNVDFLFDWLLFGFGHKGTPEPPKEDDSEFKGASERILKAINIAILMRDAHDYLGEILADNAYGKYRGFYPTPMEVSEMMAVMTLGGEDCREETVCDPCVGTGRLLLAASNYSYRLYGMDIDGTVIKACLINGYLYAPWLVRPFPFLDGDHTQESKSVTISNAIASQAAVPNTEPDRERWRWEPIKKRKRIGDTIKMQGQLLQLPEASEEKANL